MPASKYVNVLAILRKNLGLKQSELAEFADCSVSTIQSIEANRLKMSSWLAGKISYHTRVDLDWILANDVTVPMPPRRFFMEEKAPKSLGESRQAFEEQDYIFQIRLLMDVFSRLFAAARKLEPASDRRLLELTIAEELDRLKKTEGDPKAAPLHPASKDVYQYFDHSPGSLDPDLAGFLDIDSLILMAPAKAELDPIPAEPEHVNAPPHRDVQKKPKRLETAPPKRRQAPKRTRRST
jgi:transcriptional regulator with XRE-family HTH domain